MEHEVLQTSSHGLKNTAIWRLLDGRGATPEVAKRTPVANRAAAGRLDFVLQVQMLPMLHSDKVSRISPKMLKVGSCSMARGATSDVMAHVPVAHCTGAGPV